LDIGNLEGNPATEFEHNITMGLINCHLFEVSDDVKRLLIELKTPKENDMFFLPFPVIFIDVEFKKKQLKEMGIDIGYDEIHGIIVGERKVILDENKKEIGRSLTISISGFMHGEGSLFDTYAEELNFYDEYKHLLDEVEFTQEPGLDKKTRRFIKHFVLNFLNFVNNPEVEYVETRHDVAWDEKRMAKGKLPIPPRSVIKISGKLKRYLEDVKANPQWHYKYSFYVRKHFRTLRNPRYGNNVGKRIIIFSYVKGKGPLLEKTYLVDDKLDGDVDEL
jgi:hypothetical protein